jgi:glycosyltransferase involved in cell wall biosynthesis
MKIAFLGQRKFFDYFKIGGFESFIRRLATGLANLGNDVEYILYDAPAEHSVEVLPNLTVNYLRTFEEVSSRLLTGGYDHVFRVWLARRDRLKYLWLTRTAGGKTRWHHCYLAWPDSLIKRHLAMLEGRLDSRGGFNLCVSPRQYQALKKVGNQARLLIPPVPEEYFIRPENKRLDDRIRVTFLGNLSRDKCIEEVMALLTNLQNSPRFHCSIYGTHDRLNPESVEMHNRLRSQHDITYVNIDMEKYSGEIDTLVRDILHDTDVFLQPYRTLQNTLDLPLLLLEAMASLCAVITTPAGDVANIYGESKFVIPLPQFLHQAENLLINLSPEQLMAERKRLHRRNREINFGLASVAGRLGALLRG